MARYKFYRGYRIANLGTVVQSNNPHAKERGRRSNPSKITPALERQPTAIQSPQQVRAFNPSPSIMSTQSSFIRNLLGMPHEPITVVPLDTEINNGPFSVMHFTDHNASGILHNGYYIKLPDMDIQFCMGNTEHIAAWMVGLDQVMFKVPSGCWAFLNNGKALEQAKLKAGFTHPRIIEAFTVARNDIVANPDRHYKYYLLTFPIGPDNLGLNNEVFSANAENSKHTADVHFVESKVDVSTPSGKQTLTSYRAHIVWNIAIKERVPRYVKEATAPTNPLDDKVNSMFSNLTVSSAGLGFSFVPAPAPAPASAPPPAPAPAPAPAPPPANAMVLYETPPLDQKKEGTPSVALGIKQNKPTTEDLAKKSRRDDSKAKRKAKRQAKRKAIRSAAFPSEPPTTSLQQAAAASPTVAMVGDAPVVDSQGRAITTDELASMVDEYARSHGQTYEDACAFLSQTTDAQAFVNQFASFLNDPSQAWYAQEKEISFDDGEQEMEEEPGMLDSDLDSNLE